jgi:hypothetical protein
MIVGAHMTVCGLLFSLLSRAGVATGASLAAVLVLAIHPITFEPVLWLAEGGGYVLGNLLTILAVWSYLEYERRSRLVPDRGCPAHARRHIGHRAPVRAWCAGRRSPSQVTMAPPGTCLAAARHGVVVVIFLAIHFGLFAGTGGRLTARSAIGNRILLKLGWS